MFEIFLVFFYTFLFSWFIFRGSFFNCEGLAKRYLILAFGAKVLAGLILGYIYMFHYPDRLKADTLKFFDDSKVIFDLLKTHPSHFVKIFSGIGASDPALTPTYMQLNSWMYEEFMNSNRMMIRIDILFRFLIPGNFYFAHVVFINFLSFTGLVYLFKIFSRLSPLNKKLIYGLVFFMPSLLFWGSGLLKESILLLGLGSFLYHFVLFLEKDHSPYRLIPLLLSGLLLTFIKIYVPLVLTPLLIAWFWVDISPGRVIGKYLLSCAVFFLLLFNMNFLFPRYNLSHYLFIKQRDFLALVRTEKPTSAIAIPVMEPTFGSVLKNAPRGFLTTLTRPYLLESFSPFILMASLENAVILLLLAGCIIFFRRPPPASVNFIAFSLCLVVILFVLIGMVTPVEGAIVRYKCVALPFLCVALLTMTDTSRLFNKRTTHP